MNPDAVAKMFVDYYYNIYDTNRPELVSLYEDDSILTFQGEKFHGIRSIAEKFASLPFEKSKHIIGDVVCDTSISGGGMLVVVRGILLVPGSQCKFTQIFLWMPTWRGGYSVMADIFYYE